MRDVGVAELQANLQACLASVQAGEVLRVVSRGKVVARLVPEPSEVEAARQRLAALRDTLKWAIYLPRSI